MKALRVPLALAALAGTLAQAQNTVTASPSPSAETTDSVRRTPAQLEQLLGPIALYPDALVAIMLPASTVPADIVMAARYLRDNPGLAPSQLEHRTWDESVKSLVRYPDVLRWMDENLDWTKQVGEAFVAQPAEVMQAMQRLRAKARAAGTLVDTPQQQVIADTEVIRIVPAQADLIYVPHYEPEVVYVNQPVYSAWPYVTFGVGFAVGSWLAYDCDWRYNRIWVGNPYRPWYGHNWCYPLIRPPFPYYPGAPVYGYGGYGYGPYPRPWCPPAYAHRPPYYRPGMANPGVPRPSPIGSVAGNTSLGAATLQPGSGGQTALGGATARSVTPGMRRDPATGFWTSVPSAPTNLGGRPAGMAATNAARSAARGLYTSPSASGARSSSLPNTVPQFSSSRGGSLPSTVPQFQGSGGGSLPNTVPQFRGSGIGSLPATVPRFRGSGTASLPSTVPSFRDPGVTSLPNTTPTFPGASLQTGTGRSASDRARSHGAAYAGNRGANVTSRAPSTSAGYAAATPSPAPSSPAGNTWQRQGRDSTVVQNYPGQRSVPSTARPSAPVADATSASTPSRAYAGRASPPAYAPRPSAPVAADATSASASPRVYAGRASPSAYAPPSYTAPAYAPPAYTPPAAASVPNRAQPAAGRSGPPPAASRAPAAAASQSSGGESTAAATTSAPAPSTGSSAGWGSRGMGRSGGGRF